MHPAWTTEAVYYHVYPLGALGAPERNDHHSPPAERLAGLYAWLDHVQWTGANTVLLGPVLESSTHGYDTADYYRVDRRLGSNDALAEWSRDLHSRGLRLVLDGVFHHVGRHFWAFRDVLQHGPRSTYRDWFHLDFSGRSPHGDPFAYQGWNGHYDLIKLNLANPDARAHLLAAVTHWIDAYGIDGLRLDAADVLAKDFLRALAAHCRAMRPGFWLMGEVIHSENREWANPETLHSATYYELFKGLWSSRNDCNYFELAHTLQRQVGEGGVYRGCTATTSPTTTTSNASRPASPTRRTSIPCTPCSSRFPAARLPTTAARPACPAARRPTATPASAPPSILPASASKGPRPC